MPRDLEPQQLSPAVTQDQERKQEIKGQRRTTHRSMAAIAGAWFPSNVFQFCEGDVPLRTMYLETVDWATSKPSIKSSP